MKLTAEEWKYEHPKGAIIWVKDVMPAYELQREIRIAKEEAYQDGYRKGLKECHKLPTRPIILDESTGNIDFKCSCCGHEYIVSEEHKPKYCSECGRKNKGEDGKKKEKLLFDQKRCIRICEKEGID